MKLPTIGVRAVVALLCVVTLYLVAACSPDPAAPASTAGFEDPLPRWTGFFNNTFGHAPGPAMVGDFNGDGLTDVATQIRSQIVVFHDTRVGEPKDWEILDAEDGVRVEIKPASFAIERLPSLKGQLSDKQSVFVAGTTSPVISFWYAKESAYAWLQVVPKEFEPARADAEKRLSAKFGITRNNHYGLGSGFYGEEHLLEQFVADFDGDGIEEYLAVEATKQRGSQFYLYRAGSTIPVIQSIGYSGTKASLHRNPMSETILVPHFDSEEKPDLVKTKGAYIELRIPEASGVFVVLDKQWKMLWVVD